MVAQSTVNHATLWFSFSKNSTKIKVWNVLQQLAEWYIIKICTYDSDFQSWPWVSSSSDAIHPGKCNNVRELPAERTSISLNHPSWTLSTYLYSNAGSNYLIILNVLILKIFICQNSSVRLSLGCTKVRRMFESTMQLKILTLLLRLRATDATFSKAR